MATLILVTGGARSGKSSFALDLSESIGNRRLFVATCPHLDDEMNLRVERHKEERQGRGWKTAEIELQLESIFPEVAANFDVILIDCITLWVNNLLFDAENRNLNIDDEAIKSHCLNWLHKMDNYSGTVVCVTNEVGYGIVPENKTARLYRDLVGTCNQTIGRYADKVALVSCGIALYLKQ